MDIVKITRNNFKQEVARSDLPVLLDFYAPWCLPSKIADFVLKSVNNQFHDNIKIGKIDIESQPYLAKMFEIKNTPTFMLVDDGIIKKTIIGTRTVDVILKKLL